MFVLLRKILVSLLLLLLASAVSGQAMAQAAECGQKRGKSAAALDEMTWKKLNDVYEDVGAELYDTAFEELLKIYPRAYDDYQKAIIAQALAQVEWARSNYDSS